MGCYVAWTGRTCAVPPKAVGDYAPRHALMLIGCACGNFTLIHRVLRCLDLWKLGRTSLQRFGDGENAGFVENHSARLRVDQKLLAACTRAFCSRCTFTRLSGSTRVAEPTVVPRAAAEWGDT